MEIPERFLPIMQQLLNQLMDFEKAHGSIPSVRLVLTEHYERLANLGKRQQSL